MKHSRNGKGHKSSKDYDRSDSNSRRPFYGNRDGYRPPSTSQDSSIPILMYGARTNFIEYRRRLSSVALEKFPLIGNIIEDNKYSKLREVGAYDPANDAHGLELKRWQEETSIRLKKLDMIEQEKTKFYGMIMGTLSPESEQRIMQLPDWENEIKKKRDPLKLWKAIVTTHVGSNTGSSAVDKEIARRNYQNIHQGQNSLTDHLRRFRLAVEGLTAVNVEKPHENDQAVHFLESLNREMYGDLQAMLSNNAILGIGDYPKTVADAYEVASKFRVKVTKKNGNVSYQQAVFVTNFQKGNKKFKGKNSNQSSNKSDESSHEERKDNNKQRNKVQKNACGLCGQAGHYMLYCPRLDEARSCIDCNPKDAVVHFTTNSATEARNDSSLILGGESRSNRKPVFTVTNVFVGHDDKERADFHPFDVLLDNQATILLFHNRRLVKNLRKAEYTVLIYGVSSEPLSTNIIGDVLYYGTVWYCPQVPVNILPASGVEMKFDIEYHPKLDYTVIIDRKKSIKHVFKKRILDNETGCGLYVCNMDPRLLYKNESIHVTTVSMNEAKYSKREVDQAKYARDIIRMLGYPSESDMQAMINGGALIESPITVHDVKRARDIYGDVIANLKGKSKARSSIIVDPAEVIPRIISSDLVLHVDLMFVDAEPYLLSISTPLELLMVNRCVSGRGSAQVKDVIMHQIGEYKAKNFAIKTILCDGEGAVHALRNDFLSMGISVNNAGPGQHVPLIEVKVREVKERCRCHIAVLPYALPASFTEWLIYFCVSRINLFPTRNNLSRISPREAFTGRKTNFKRDIRIGFWRLCSIRYSEYFEEK